MSSPWPVAGARPARRSLRRRVGLGGRRPLRVRHRLGGPSAGGRGRLRRHSLPRAGPRLAPSLHRGASPGRVRAQPRAGPLHCRGVEEAGPRGRGDPPLRRPQHRAARGLAHDGGAGALRGEPARGAHRRRPRHAEPAREPGLSGPLRLGRRRGAAGVRPQRQPGGLRGPAEERHRRAGQDRPRPLLEPVQLPWLQGPHRGTAGSGGHPHLQRPRGGRLQAGAGVPRRPLGPRKPHPEGRDHLRLHRPRRPSHPRLALPSGGAPGEAGGGTLAPEDRRAAPLVEGREAAPREHGRSRRTQGLAGRPPLRVPPRRREGSRPPQGADGQPGRSELRRRGAPARVGAARRVGHPRQPPRRVGVRRRRSLERHRFAHGGDAGLGRAGPVGAEAAPHARLLLLGRRGGRPHRLDGVGRAASRTTSSRRPSPTSTSIPPPPAPTSSPTPSARWRPSSSTSRARSRTRPRAGPSPRPCGPRSRRHEPRRATPPLRRTTTSWTSASAAARTTPSS